MSETTLSTPATLPAVAYLAPVARVFTAAIFLLSGYGKIADYAGTLGYMASANVPGVLLPVVIAVELIGGILLVVGWNTRLAALALAGFTLVSGLLFHNNLADTMQFINFWKNISMTGGLLAFVIHGAGALSVDARRG